VRIIDRPPTLPRSVSRLDLWGLTSRQPGASASSLAIVGGGVGAFRTLELGGQLPITLSPGRVTIAGPSLYAAYGLNTLGGSLAPTVQVVFPLADADPFFVDVGATYSYTVREAYSLTATPTFSLDTRSNGDGTSLSVPVSFAGQASERVSWQLGSGAGLSRFDPRFGLSRRRESLEFDEVTVPLSAEVTYTLSRSGQRHPLGDLILQVYWPQFYTHAPGLRGTHTNDWTLQLQTSWYSVP
jgi:hypothetical protein